LSAARLGFLLALALPAILPGQQPDTPCASCAVWNKPQTPFRVYGNTWYVGPHGLSSILITSAAGHILIDGAIAESAPQIAANIRSLGFRMEDVKIILNSHVHHDHAGGIAELQRLSGARVIASKWSAAVLTKGGVGQGDPQYGSLRPVAPVSRVEILTADQTVRLGKLSLSAHSTPGHTPGGTSWAWKSCESGRCLNLVYADSATAVSAAGFKFTSRRDYPNAVPDFEKTFAFFETVPCDILLTAHPEVAGLWDHLEQRERGLPDAMVNPAACRQLAGHAREQFEQRLAGERKGDR
jgi:metallo-beta-lactamase class B